MVNGVKEEIQFDLNVLKETIEKNEPETFRELFLHLHPYEQSLAFQLLSKEERLEVYAYLSPFEVSEVIEYIDLDEAVIFMTEMEPRFATDVLAEMAVDDAVDILQQLSIDEVASLLVVMDKDAADEIKTLLHYEEKTAGSIMTTEYVSLYTTQTVREALQEMKDKAPDAETIYYTYVLDEQKHLVGVISLRDLIVADEDEKIEHVMSENVVSVSVGRDQREVAQMIRDYDFIAMPVVDFQNHLLGIITVDDIIDVMEEEASEEYSKFAALSGKGTRELDVSPVQAARKRLPWLIILLFLGMITASLIGSFESTLEQVPIVAIFIPLIAGMAGNAGTQSLAVAVRGLAMGEYIAEKKLKLVLKEITTGVLVGGSCGIVVTCFIYFWKGSFFLGLLVGIAILATLTVATLSGALIPLIMERLNIDPAVASGPFITTLNDITSVIIYFGMATVFISYLL